MLKVCLLTMLLVMVAVVVVTNVGADSVGDCPSKALTLVNTDYGIPKDYDRLVSQADMVVIGRVVEIEYNCVMLMADVLYKSNALCNIAVDEVLVGMPPQDNMRIEILDISNDNCVQYEPNLHPSIVVGDTYLFFASKHSPDIRKGSPYRCRQGEILCIRNGRPYHCQHADHDISSDMLKNIRDIGAAFEIGNMEESSDCVFIVDEVRRSYIEEHYLRDTWIASIRYVYKGDYNYDNIEFRIDGSRGSGVYTSSPGYIEPGGAAILFIERDGDYNRLHNGKWGYYRFSDGDIVNGNNCVVEISEVKRPLIDKLRACVGRGE